MPSRCSMVAICGPPPCTTTGLMAVCSNRTISRANAFATSSAPMAWPPYLMTMVSSSYRCMCGSASDRMWAWSSGLISGASVMKRVSWSAGLRRFLSDWRPGRKVLLLIRATDHGFLPPPGPCRRHRQREPARDQERAACWGGHREQAVAGKLPQRQVARKHCCCDDKPERGCDPDRGMNDAVLGERHHRKDGGGVKQ